ncbi:MAG: signal recognition particle-docking protein FtsY, partial [Syntrophobacter sp. DG_60]
MKGIFTRLRDGLAKTRKALTEQVDRLVVGKREIDDEALERLEEILIMGDVGVKATNKLIQQLSQMVSKKEINDLEQLKQHLTYEVLKFLDVDAPPFDVSKAKPFVIMVIGVNGTGKTTAIAKMAKWFKDQGKQSILAAADTFRAAAIEQLEIWGRRANVDIIKRKAGADPSAVVF